MTDSETKNNAPMDDNVCDLDDVWRQLIGAIDDEHNRRKK